MNMDCDRARELLSARLDRPLDDREDSMLHQHLARCPECTRYQSTLLTGMDGVAALPPIAGSMAVRAAVLERIEGQGGRTWIGQGARLLVGTAVAIALTLVLVTVFRGTDDPDGGLAGGSNGSFGTGPETTTTPEQVVDDTAVPISTLAATLESMTVCIPGIVVADEDEANEGIHIWAVVEAVQECTLSETIEIQLVGPDGEPLAIENNPLSLPLISLSSRPLNYAGLVWENWCGDADVTAEATNGIGGAAQALDATPACANPDAPSHLTASDSPPPPNTWAADGPPQPSDPSATVCTLSISSLDMSQEAVGDDVVISVSGVPETPCQEGATLTISLVDDSGALLDVENNPAEVPAHQMDDDGRLYASVNWANWCDDAQALVALESKEGTADQPLDPTPRCVDPNAPSRLEWVSVADATEQDPLLTCTAEEISFSLSVERSHGDVIIAANAGTEDLSGNVAPECMLPADAPTFTISDAEGNPLTIEGNGLATALSVPAGSQIVAPIAGFAHAVWGNWCGVSADVVVHATFGGATADLTIDGPPVCENNTAPSTLTAYQEPVTGTDEILPTATP